MNIAKWIANINTVLREGFSRFPETIVMAILASTTFIVLSHLEYNKETEELFVRIGMMFALGVPAFLVKTLLFERLSHITPIQNWKVYAVVNVLILGALTGYYFLLPSEIDFEAGARYAVIFASLMLAFLGIPYAFQREHFEKYILVIAARFAITYIFANVLLLGLFLILLTIDGLFDTKLIENMLFDVTVAVQGIFAPVFFLSFFPRYEKNMEDVEYAMFFRILLNGIVIPILAIYTLVLTAYFLFILVALEWPRGVVTNMVIWFSIVSTVILFIARPIRDSNRWMSIFVRWFPFVLIPMLALMFFSVIIRIQQYGVTESRYMVVAVGIWLVLVAAYWAINHQVRNIWLPFTLILFLLVTILSPFNLFRVSIQSQNERFENIMNQYNFIQDGTVKKPTKKQINQITEEDKTQISAILEYFNDSHSIQDIEVLPSSFKIEQAFEYFGVETYRMTTPVGKEEYFNYGTSEKMIADISEYDYMYDNINYYGEKTVFSKDEITVEQKEYRQIIIKKSGKIALTIDLEKAAKELHKNYGAQFELKQSQLKFQFSGNTVDATIQFANMSGLINQSSANPRIDSLSYYLFIKVN